MKRLNLLFAFTTLLLLSSVAGAQSPASAAASIVGQRPTTAVAPGSCVTAECHANIKATPVLHAPVATDDCDSCHQLDDVARHTFSVTREKADLCTYCHDFKVSDMPVVHKPVTQGECLGCHNPHGGQTKSLVLENTTPQLCGRCHESVTHNKSFLHGPVAQGACDSCHAPHAAKFKNLLDAVGSDMCLTCHKELEPALSTAKFKHKALDEGCEKCHDAHGSNLPMSLPQEMPGLCMSCHQELKDKVAGATVKHSAISSDRTCMNCHSPHASNIAKLQKDVTVVTCLKCHDKPIKADAGYTVAAVPEVMDPKLVKHGEIKDGNCGGCHEVHGGERRNLLTRPYAQGFFQQFSASNFALCFPCHDVQLVELEKTTKATGFRNGEKNLHFVHASFGNRYKNCRTCHASHAGTNDRLVREKFTFGKRDLPIRFTRTETGGTCAPGCHGSYAYDREKAIPLPTTTTTQPATAPATSAIAGIPRAQYQEAREVAWTARDISGNEVKVPASGRATALIMVSADEATSLALVEKLHKAFAADDKTQFVVIAGGKNSGKRAADIAAKAGSWPVVADPDSSAAKALDARGWPLVIVLDSTGLEIARLTGEPDLLATKLRAYLQLAAGQIDKQTLAADLATTPVAQADAKTQLARDLRAARLLMQQGKATQAIAYIDEMRTTVPEAQVIRAKALVLLNKPDDALRIVDRLKRGSAPDADVELVRAMALISLERWYLARPLLEQYIITNPGVAEAHMLLGSIYEHDNNWPKAAEQYKAASEAKKP